MGLLESKLSGAFKMGPGVAIIQLRGSNFVIVQLKIDEIRL